MRRFYVHPLIYQFIGGLIMIAGALMLNVHLVLVGGVLSLLGLLKMTLQNKR